MAYKKYGKLLLLVCLKSSAIFAATQTPGDVSLLSPLKNGHVIFEAGTFRISTGKSQHINIQNLIGDTFTVSDHNDTNALFGLGYFVDGKNFRSVNMSYGVNAFYLAPTSVSGNVIQENLFTNLSYRYSVSNIPIYASAKAIINFNSPKYALVIDAGVGPNFMKVYGFHEDSLDGVTIPEHPFSANTKTNLSATLGMGLRFNQIFGTLSAECGYRFFYLGEGEFKINNSQVLNTLKTGTSYANAIQCSVSN